MQEWLVAVDDCCTLAVRLLGDIKLQSQQFYVLQCFVTAAVLPLTRKCWVVNVVYLLTVVQQSQNVRCDCDVQVSALDAPMQQT